MLRCFLVFHVRVNLKAIVHQNKLMGRLYGRNGKRGIVVKHFSNDIIKLTESKRLAQAPLIHREAQSAGGARLRNALHLPSFHSPVKP